MSEQRIYDVKYVEGLVADCEMKDKRIDELQDLYEGEIENRLNVSLSHDKGAARIEQLEADCEMKDKRIDWTVADNAKKAIRIEQLEDVLLGPPELFWKYRAKLQEQDEATEKNDE